MTDVWSSDELNTINAAHELAITTTRRDGTTRPDTPIWVVVTGGEVYVRTWHRRETGWFGEAVHTQQARISVPGLTADATVEDLGADGAGPRADIDAAYRTKYGHSGDTSVGGMLTKAAAASTLRLRRR